MPAPSHARFALAAGPLAAALLATAGCASGTATDAGSAATTQIAVVLSNDGCPATPASVAAGPAKITISNRGGSAVSEAELVQGSKILGEKEGLTPGLSGAFSLNLSPGRYEMYCPHAKVERTTFTVTGTDSAAATSSAAALLGKAAQRY